MKNIIAIIPARSGSKGIKNKNIKLLDGIPLMAYTIKAALKSEIFTDVLVSTDSKEYKQIAEKFGAWVPFLRKDELAKDESLTIDVIEETLIKLDEEGKKYEEFMLLQPTSPLRDEEDIIKAYNIFINKQANSVVSMCECKNSPILSTKLNKDLSLDGFLSNINNKVRRQDLEKYYTLNGAIYLSNVNYFMKYKNFYGKRSYAYIMEREKSIDIDNINDFKYAEYIIKSRRECNE